MYELKQVVNEPKYTGYKIYVTGHSLGGALSSLCAFQIAAEAAKEGSNIPTPINNISIASPYIGDECFRKSFMVRLVCIYETMLFIISLSVLLLITLIGILMIPPTIRIIERRGRRINQTHSCLQQFGYGSFGYVHNTFLFVKLSQQNAFMVP